MFCPFRPTFETLENREVFSAGPLAVMPLAIPAGDSGQPPAGVYAAAARVEFASVTRPFADGLALTVIATGDSTGSATGTYDLDSRGPNVPAAGVFVASADFNRDGMDGVVASSNNSWGGTGYSNFILPYIEQDNLYKSSQPHDRLFAELGSGNDLWLGQQSHSQILTGLWLP